MHNYRKRLIVRLAQGKTRDEDKFKKDILNQYYLMHRSRIRWVQVQIQCIIFDT